MSARLPFLKKLFPQSLGGQLLVMLLLALAITQGLGLVLLTDERNRAVRAALGLEAAGRAANVVLLLDSAPADLRQSILRAADSPLVRFDVGTAPEAPHDSADADVVLRQIRQILGEPEREVRADVHVPAATAMPTPNGVPVDMRPMHDAMMAGRTEPVELTLSIRLAGGDWLNVRTMFHRPGLQLSPQALLPLLLMAVAVALVAWWTAWRVVGPMRSLAIGADRLGRGLEADPLPLTGPSEVQETTRAFNRMKDRLTRFVNERTHMLAALSHDLRSPLTAMRLRIEMLDETEDSLRLKALVEEMQAMVEATLEFARGVARAEAATELDLAELLRRRQPALLQLGTDGRAVQAGMGQQLGQDDAGRIARAAGGGLQGFEEHLLELLEIGARMLEVGGREGLRLASRLLQRQAGALRQLGQRGIEPGDDLLQLLLGLAGLGQRWLQQRLGTGQRAVEHGLAQLAQRGQVELAAADLGQRQLPDLILQVQALLDRSLDIGFELRGGAAAGLGLIVRVCHRMFSGWWAIKLQTVHVRSLAHRAGTGKKDGERRLRRAGARRSCLRPWPGRARGRPA